MVRLTGSTPGISNFGATRSMRFELSAAACQCPTAQRERSLMHSVTETIPLLPSSIGTQRHLTVHRFGNAKQGPKIYLQGGLHADEAPGMVVLSHLVKLLEAREGEPSGEIVVVPCANPIGLSQRMQGHHAGRSDLGLGGNFNRSFPNLNPIVGEQLARLQREGRIGDESSVKLALREAATTLVARDELESMKQTLLKLAVDADFVLDAHCADEAVVYAYVSNPEHPAANLLSRCIGSVATIGGIPESLDFPAACLLPWRAAKHFLPDVSVTEALTATLEYRGTRGLRDDVAMDDARGLIRFMEAVNILTPNGTPQPQSQIETCHTTLNCVDYVRASAPGVVIFSKGPGVQVYPGEEVAQILDPASGDRHSLKARGSGIIFGHLYSQVVVPGSTVAWIACNSPLEQEPGDPYP
ncbi:MAG: hypothetical protein EOR30_27745 [Mesorhizobium sp.]|nr:MAG: hypothetical protein EOR30_27745 [Mesorhizobium sp.]RWJ58209.1 MAG: hypothetical protein EOR32_26925 [Mesorhizobium sp.]RWJ61393.1 MAG: hypothetical protein EOR34_34985 [Mesorhizobium sp.]RWJ91984.1 MAG: hypothetical protein EOR38_33620 [Mesorhizobium sp.]